MSGHWWAYIDGIGWQTVMANDKELYFPMGVWFVTPDNHFHTMRESDLRMTWIDGNEIHEKVIEGPLNKISSRIIGSDDIAPPEDVRQIENGG